MTDPAPAAEAAVAADLARIAGGTPEQLADLRGRYHAAAQRAREQLALVDAALVEHIEANGGKPIRVSDELELRAVTEKTTKCVDISGALGVLLYSAAYGDLCRLADFIASDGLKPGACRKVMDPGDYSRLFETTVRTRLEGRPVKKLAVVNPRLLDQIHGCPTGAEQE